MDTVMKKLQETFSEVITSPVNLALVAAIAYLTVQIYKQSRTKAPPPPKPKLAPLKKQDMTVEQLAEYDGLKGEGRVLVAINRKIFDVSPKKSLYGPGGAYRMFAGRDATRALALFAVDQVKEEYDDYSGITPAQMQSAKEWEEQFQERYEVVGKLLAPGEAPTTYDDAEDQTTGNCSDNKKSE